MGGAALGEVNGGRRCVDSSKELREGTVHCHYMTTIAVGDHEMEFGGPDLVELRDSSDVVDDGEALRARMREDGYLFIRGFHDPETVRTAKRDVLEDMADQGMLDPTEPIEEAVVHPDIDSVGWDMNRGRRWTRYDTAETLATGDTTMTFMERFLGAHPFDLDYRWGRAKARGDFTEFHADIAYMNYGTDRLYTKWQPLCDCPLDRGPLVVCPGSHTHEGFQETYGQLDADADDIDPMLADDAADIADIFDRPLATTNFEAGDALIFNVRTLHGSLTNRTDRYRISIDNRYQSIREPTDPRYVGEDPPGNLSPPSDNRTLRLSKLVA